jgi:flavin-binding protein dodecin
MTSALGRKQTYCGAIGDGPARRDSGSTIRSRVPNHVYKILELTGSSPAGIEAAVSTAIAKADETVRNMQWFEVVETRGHIQDGKVAHWQ